MDEGGSGGEEAVVNAMEGVDNFGFEVGGGGDDFQVGFKCDIKVWPLHDTRIIRMYWYRMSFI